MWRSSAGKNDGEERVSLVSKNGLKVALVALIVGVCVDESSRFGSMSECGISVEFDGGLSREDEKDVPEEQDRDGNADSECENEGEHDGRSGFFGFGSF